MKPNEKLLEILVCPKCHGTIIYEENENKIICKTCRLKFEILDGIPIMLIDEAESY